MRKELGQQALEELSFLKDWNEVIVDFIIKNEGGIFFKQMIQIITETFDKKDLRGMRMINRDINEMARDFPHDKLSGLNQILKEKFGCDLTKAHGKELAKIKRIVQRGYLKNDDEFRLLLSRVEEIYAEDKNEKEVETLNNLMDDYETSKEEKLLNNRTFKK